MPRSRALYRYLDAGGQLLYVGVSFYPVARLRGHTAPWVDQVARIEIERFDTSRDALDAEKNAIRDERPVHNVSYSKTPPGRSPAKPLEPVEHQRLFGIWKNSIDYPTNAAAAAAMGKGWSVSKAIKTFGNSGRGTGRPKSK